MLGTSVHACAIRVWHLKCCSQICGHARHARMPVVGVPGSSSSSSIYSFFIRCCPLNRDGRIYPIPSAIARTPSLHFARFRASSFFKPIFSVSSSTCFFQVFCGRLHFLLPLTSRFRATLKTLSSSLLSTCPCHLTPFAVANRFIISFHPQHVHLFFSCLSVNNFLTTDGFHHSSFRSPKNCFFIFF